MEAISIITGLLVLTISYYLVAIIFYLLGESFHFLISKAKREKYIFLRPKITNPLQKFIQKIQSFSFWLYEKKKHVHLIVLAIKDIFWFLKLMARSDMRIKNAFITFCTIYFLFLFVSFLFLDYASKINFFHLFHN